MKSEFHVAPDQVMFNSAVSACAMAGESEAAFEMLTDMKQAGFQPDRTTYSVLFEMLEMPKALDLYKQGIEQGIYDHLWKRRDELDLHTCSAAEARAVLRYTLSEYASGARRIDDLVVITGHSMGRDSAPVLAVEARRVFAEVPMRIIESQNPGRFVVPKASIDAACSAETFVAK